MDKILTVIPARIGSKRIPKKNIKILDGNPLIYYVIAAAQKANLVNDIVVSTDSMEIANVAKRYGVQSIFRPSKLSGDNIFIIDVLHHIMLFTLNEMRIRYDAFLSIQPTSPLLTSETIDKVIDTYLSNTCKSVATITRLKDSMHPHLSKKVLLENCVVQALPETMGRIQQLPAIARMSPAYYCNGAAFLRHRSLLLELDYYTNALGFGFLGVEMEEEESINIDTPLDFDIAEFLVRRRNK